MRERPPLSPADYMRLTPGPRYKLLAYVTLIKHLMDAGFNDYRIWRYLTSEHGVSTGRTTVFRFCTALRAGTLLNQPSMASTQTEHSGGGRALPRPTGVLIDAFRPRDPAGDLDCGPQTVPSAIQGVDAAPTAGRDGKPYPSPKALAPRAAIREVVGQTESGNVGGQPITSCSPANDECAGATFGRPTATQACILESAQRGLTSTHDNQVRTFSASIPEARRKVRALRAALRGDDAYQSKGDSHSDERDDFERR